MLTQPVTKDTIVNQLDNLSPNGLAEVAHFIEFLQFRELPAVSSLSTGEHVAFGIWADHPEASTDPAAFALKLRQNMEKRSDG